MNGPDIRPNHPEDDTAWMLWARDFIRALEASLREKETEIRRIKAITNGEKEMLKPVWWVEEMRIRVEKAEADVERLKAAIDEHWKECPVSESPFFRFTSWGGGRTAERESGRIAAVLHPDGSTVKAAANPPRAIPETPAAPCPKCGNVGVCVNHEPPAKARKEG